MAFVLQNLHASTSCAEMYHLCLWEGKATHSLVSTLHPVTKMASICPVNAELLTKMVTKSAGVWTEMEARLKDWQSVVSIQKNTHQSPIFLNTVELWQSILQFNPEIFHHILSIDFSS